MEPMIIVIYRYYVNHVIPRKAIKLSKRFIDTDIWKKKWFRKFKPDIKILFVYLFTNCDNAGVWEADKELAEFQIGTDYKWEEVQKALKNHIKIINNGEKWWMLDFIPFQYGTLKPTCKPHLHVIELLKKHNLFKGYSKGIHTLKDKDKDTDKDKDKDTDSENLQDNKKTIDNLYTENDKIPPSPVAEIWGYYIGGKDMMQGMTPTIKRYIAEGMEVNPDPLWWKVYCDRRLADDPKFMPGPHKFFTAGGYQRYIEKNSGGIFEE
jgi:hypothetical protein